MSPALSRDNTAETREQIIAAATHAFRQTGYNASMDHIARLAGVAKQTLYNNFSGKDALFAEVVRRCSADVHVTLRSTPEELTDQNTLRQILLRFSSTLRQRLLSDEGLAAFRTMLCEASRFPELARAFYDNGPAPTTAMLERLLTHAMTAKLLRQEDPAFAADMLLGMLTSERTRLLYSSARPDTEPDTSRVHQIVDCFLLAFAPITTASL